MNCKEGLETVYAVFIDNKNKLQYEIYSIFEELHYIFSGTKEQCKKYIEVHNGKFSGYTEFFEYLKKNTKHNLLEEYNEAFKKSLEK